MNIQAKLKEELRPTPIKFHYNFTIRDVSRVLQRIFSVIQNPQYNFVNQCDGKITPELYLIGLWRHECERTFADRLCITDKDLFTQIFDETTKEKFKNLGFDDKQLITTQLFADFQRESQFDEDGQLISEAPTLYEVCPDIDSIRAIVSSRLEDYNQTHSSKPLDLVMFDDALKHVLKMTRVINSPGGNYLIIGVVADKLSLTKLASFICNQVFF